MGEIFKKNVLGLLHSLIFKNWFLKFHATLEARREDFLSGDPVRYGAIRLALETIEREGISGDFAEVGVYQGKTSAFIHRVAPKRRFYLFDTFEGFPGSDLDNADGRFKDTSMEIAKRNIGNLDQIEFRKGYFPQTAIGLENNRFAFVMLDADLYAPTLAGLEFFYPRLAPGGYLFLHDHNSPESNHAVSRASALYMADKPELIIEIPDIAGSVVFRKHKTSGN